MSDEVKIVYNNRFEKPLDLNTEEDSGMEEDLELSFNASPFAFPPLLPMPDLVVDPISLAPVEVEVEMVEDVDEILDRMLERTIAEHGSSNDTAIGVDGCESSSDIIIAAFKVLRPEVVVEDVVIVDDIPDVIIVDDVIVID